MRGCCLEAGRGSRIRKSRGGGRGGPAARFRPAEAGGNRVLRAPNEAEQPRIVARPDLHGALEPVECRDRVVDGPTADQVARDLRDASERAREGLQLDRGAPLTDGLPASDNGSSVNQIQPVFPGVPPRNRDYSGVAAPVIRLESTARRSRSSRATLIGVGDDWQANGLTVYFCTNGVGTLCRNGSLSRGRPAGKRPPGKAEPPGAYPKAEADPKRVPYGWLVDLPAPPPPPRAADFGAERIGVRVVVLDHHSAPRSSCSS